jgi:hypothetical protein
MDRDSWHPFFALVLFCGAALVLSIPGAGVVQELAYVQQVSRTTGLDMARVFLDAYILCLGLLGLRLGSSSAERGERGRRMIIALALRVLIGQLFCLPYLAFSCSLFPGREGGLALVLLLATLTSLTCALLNWLIEESGKSPTRPFTGYVLFLGIAFAPLVGIPFLSPVGAARLLLESATPLQALAAFAAPAALLAAVSLLAVRHRGETRG